MSVIADLQRDGFAQRPAWPELGPDLTAALDQALETLTWPRASGLKPYLVQAFGRYPLYNSTSIWAQVATALEPFAGAYLDGPVRLHHYNVWKNQVTGEAPTQSQLWHRDGEDTRILKAFYYASDVTADAGPLQYIPGTHWCGTRKVQPQGEKQAFAANASVFRATDDQMAAVVPKDEWRIATGPPGTVVLVDTTGWHAGGWCTGKDRIVAVWHWVTAECPYPPRFKLTDPQVLSSADPWGLR